ncbi:LamG domain-containing protein [Candidatus Bathyarchaeota archaeon]|nr:LamG domain-containing protein [Candidatus Bathyarchaeota archaeon]
MTATIGSKTLNVKRLSVDVDAIGPFIDDWGSSGYTRRLSVLGLRREWRLECFESGVDWADSAAKYLQEQAAQGSVLGFTVDYGDRYAVDTDVYVDEVDLTLESGNVNYRRFTVKVTEATPFSPSGVDDSCVLYLPMDEGNGETVCDKSGQGNDGAVYGAVWVDGKYGKALYFDGVDDYVETVSMSLAADVTFTAWIKPDFDYTEEVARNIVSWRISQLGKIILGKHNTGKFLFVHDSQDFGGVWTAASYLYPFSAGEWIHVAGTREGNTLRLYINGELVKTTVNDGIADITGSAVVRVSKGVWRAWFGIIDEVHVYNRALSEDEVRQLYLSGAARIAAKSLTPTHVQAEFELAGSRQPAFESGYVEKLTVVGLKQIWRLECVEKGVPWDYSAARYLQYKAWKGRPVEFKARMNGRYETEEVEAYITGITVDLVDVDSNVRKFTVELREA